MQINVDGTIVPQSNIRTVVTKPAFQNRRVQNNYLKESYPAGFNTHQLRKQIVHKIHDSAGLNVDGSVINPIGTYTLWKTAIDDNNTMWSVDTPLIATTNLPSIHNNNNQKKMKKKSYDDDDYGEDYDGYNKNNRNDGVDIDNDNVDDDDDDDPFANVAGPYYSDLMKAKLNVKQPAKENINQFDSIITCEMPLHDRAEMFKKSMIDKVIICYMPFI